MTGSGFNLVTDPWIPVDGRHVSIEQILLDAHEFNGWPCSDPAFAEALIRLLVPMVYRVTKMDDPKLNRRRFAAEQQKLLTDKQLDPEAVREYLGQYRDRFWLLNPPSGCMPFAQDTELADVEYKEPAKAVMTWASGNNPTLGPHGQLNQLPPQIAAQQLIVQRCYSYGGRCTGHPNYRGSKPNSFQGASLRNTVCIHPVGSSFKTTLLGHLIPLAHDTEIGAPFWEVCLQNQLTPPREISGWLEQIAVRQDKTMLYQATSSNYVTGFTIAKGRGVAKELFCQDPYWLIDSKKEPMKPKLGRSFWREVERLLPQPDDVSNGRALILDWANDIEGHVTEDEVHNYAPERFAWAAISHRADKSKDLAWSCSHAPDLLAIFDDDVSKRCKKFLEAAKMVNELMTKQLSAIAKSAGATDYTDIAEGQFWRLCEPDFWENVRRPISEDDRDDRLRRRSLNGYDVATARLLQDRRTRSTVVEHRTQIERWARQRRESANERPEAK